MDRWPRRPASGALALLVLVLVAGCTVRVRPEPTAPTTAPPTPVSRGSTLATRAFVVDLLGPGRIRPGRADFLPVTMRRTSEEVDRAVGASSVVLVFPLLRVPPGCVRRVVLWLRLLSIDHEQANLAAYPSWLVSLARGRVPASTPEETLIDNRPRGIGLLTAGGAWMRFDITELYRTWADGGPFPSQLREVDPGTPLVVDVRVEDFGEPAVVARVAPVGGDRASAPRLRWTVTHGC